MFFIQVCLTRKLFTVVYKYVNYKEISNDSTNPELSYNTHAPRSALVCDMRPLCSRQFPPRPSTQLIHSCVKTLQQTASRRDPIALLFKIGPQLKRSQQIMRERVSEGERVNQSRFLKAICVRIYTFIPSTVVRNSRSTPAFTCHPFGTLFFLVVFITNLTLFLFVFIVVYSY